MAMETDIQMFFTKVDGSYPARHKDLAPVITWKTNTTPVAREFRLPIPIEHSGTVVDYSFETVNNDIQFGVLFSTTEDSKQGLLTSGGDKGDEEADMEVQEVVVERQRFASHMGPVTGTFHLARPGRLTLVWDNGYSWFKNKVLSYSVTRHVPSMLTTERAKCSRAANALDACVRDRDDAAARGHEAEVQGKEADANVELLQKELEDLQAKLARERERSEALWKEEEEMRRRKTLEELKIEGLTFRLMPMAVLALTLSFGSKEDQCLCVCKDWQEALSTGGSPRIVENGGFMRDEDA